jgi:purine-binding chemotaxis protein CheW
MTAEKSRSAAASNRFLTLTLGRELYAINARHVREIIRPGEISPVPRAPRHILGVTNLRGKIIPIIDLRVRFELEFTGRTERTCIVVVEGGPELKQTGLMVDEVQEVLTLNNADIEDAPSFGASIETACVQGVAKLKDSVMILLDLDRLLNEGQG